MASVRVRPSPSSCHFDLTARARITSSKRLQTLDETGRLKRPSGRNQSLCIDRLICVHRAAGGLGVTDPMSNRRRFQSTAPNPVRRFLSDHSVLLLAVLIAVIVAASFWYLRK